MNVKYKKCFQTLCCAVLFAYSVLLVYQTFSSGNNRISTNEQSESKPFYLDRNLAEDRSQTDYEPPQEYVGEIVTATAKPPSTTLEDVFISVKTTKTYHNKRLPIILKTWFQLARKQTWFFTDTDDLAFQMKTNGHMINTNCSASHSRKALCCKMSVEFDTFLKTDKKWFCHFDDDNYVNVPRLVRFLGDYNPRDEWYLGKPSIQAPLEIVKKEKKVVKKIKFWFATGGAGFCLSRALAAKMMPFASEGRFISTGERIRLPDDVTMGYIIEHLLKQPLTVVDQFHSHLEPMKFIRKDMIEDQISFSYAKAKDEWNVVKIDGFSESEDQYRFLSLHCFLFPYFSFCPRRR
ncbi:fringe glycosyltransferase [Diabrotica virgifera virgifera]|uniref:Fringe-like glycosyltransferase domain-containing protein n=2 Tax=Diabrotica virgifera virgifera TaxID=50390 RepID=A0ABM5JZ96_DIAVI|nr:fringe glycosyltransferase [Diabrotica virgifera virgifera]